MGRRRKYFTFDYPVLLFKIYKECKLYEYSRRYFFRIPTGVDLGYKYFKQNMKTTNNENAA